MKQTIGRKLIRTVLSAMKIWASDEKPGFRIDGYEPGNPLGITMDAFGDSQPKSALFACITILTGIFARLPHQVYKTELDGRITVDTGNPLSRLLDKPSNYMNGQTLKELLYWDVFRSGNGVAKIIRDSSGNPIELKYCKLTGPAVRWDASLDSLIYTVVFPRPGFSAVQEQVIENDLLHLRWWGYSPFSGVSPSPVESHVLQTNALYNSSVAHQLQTLNKGFSARNVIENDFEVDPKTLLDFRRDIEELYSGNLKAGKTPILFPGMSLKPVGWSTVDLQLIEILKYSVTDLSRAYGIPLFILQADERTSGWSANSLPDRWLNFERIGISPHQERFSAEFISKLVPIRMRDRGYGIRIDLESLTLSNIAQRSVTAKNLYMSGLGTKNEGRKLVGLPAMPDGDNTIDPPGGPKQGGQPKETKGSSENGR